MQICHEADMSSAATVTVYYSSVAGSVPSKKKFEAIKQLLQAHKIAHDLVDVSQAEFSAVRLDLHLLCPVHRWHFGASFTSSLLEKHQPSWPNHSTNLSIFFLQCDVHCFSKKTT